MQMQAPGREGLQTSFSWGRIKPDLGLVCPQLPSLEPKFFSNIPDAKGGLASLCFFY